jgi:hypothetical protein
MAHELRLLIRRPPRFDRGLHIVVAIGADGGVTPKQSGTFVVQLRVHPRRKSAHSSRNYCFDLAVAQRAQ